MTIHRAVEDVDTWWELALTPGAGVTIQFLASIPFTTIYGDLHGFTRVGARWEINKALSLYSREGRHMTYPTRLLADLLVGWQKVADRYHMPIYVFQTGDTYHAVSNEAQGVGSLVDTLAPQGPREPDRGIAY